MSTASTEQTQFTTATPQHDKRLIDPVLAEVNRQLFASHFPALKQLQCSFCEGVLTLRGTVPTFHHRQVAIELAKNVAGVGRVDDRIVVDGVARPRQQTVSRSDRVSEYSLLLVDDEEELLEAFGAWFSRRGFNVTTAHHPSLALAAAAYNKFDAAVIDVTLPEMNGLELIDRLRSVGNFPIIMLSGDDNPRLIAAAMERGVYRFLVKPVSLPTVEDVLQECLDDSPIRPSTPKSATRAKPAS